ncbi:hypothetical protein B4U79_15083 [Dinothrombium tinctorium]|uniref:GPR158/179 extracellular domain-containing protein n=1 Tax=Dinothrombium tinctorium TaxID=1965070 RepID=A0A3S3P2G4_9ACAR|nr:hypothetical protein B4U79_10885 [Dinothrombium tinctorium]RWS12064.1 hypothetical protein B4U79_01399 [Dinothrombium tinctorium]RWS13386.1 hypothetical protein B4U79_08477 [Dinothrombium tinctorium]RWS13479.1 hypothetical protein B4U79_15083 [Dinothrombium tinctorium]
MEAKACSFRLIAGNLQRKKNFGRLNVSQRDVMSSLHFTLLIIVSSLQSVNLSYASSVPWTQTVERNVQKAFHVPMTAVEINGKATHSSIKADAQTSARNSLFAINSEDEEKESLLQAIDEITHSKHCDSRKHTTDSAMPVMSSIVAHLHTSSISQSSNGDLFVYIPLNRSRIEMPSNTVKHKYKLTETRIRFLSILFAKINPKTNNYIILRQTIDELIKAEKDIHQVRILWLKNESKDKSDLHAAYYAEYGIKGILYESYDIIVKTNKPWLKLIDDSNFTQIVENGYIAIKSEEANSDQSLIANWTRAYFACDAKIWLFSFTSLITYYSPNVSQIILQGLISVDVNINNLDVNQCDMRSVNESNEDFTLHLFSTHKCHRDSSEVSANEIIALHRIS